MLVHAFFDNPVFIHYFPESTKREKQLQLTFEFMIRDGIRNGEVYTISSKLEGIAIWLTSK
jgi:hypothetical protein